MRRLFCLLIAAAILTAGPARAQGTPVVIELFTSQGCAACPPADELLTEIDTIEGVIALALHVDYWDYLGWKDTFGNPANTARQAAYARAVGARSVYTPQMIVNGVDHVMGTRPDSVVALIRKHQTRPMPVALSVTRTGPRLDIVLAPRSVTGSGPAEIALVRFSRHEAVRIERGENAGREMVYTNVVTGWDVIGRWDGHSPATIETDVGEAGALAVIVQRERLGPVLSAAMLR